MRQAAPAPASENVEGRAQLIAADPRAVEAALAELDQMRVRLLSAAVGQPGLNPAAGSVQHVEVSASKKPRVSVFEMLLAPGGKRLLQGGPAALAVPAAAARQGPVSDSSAYTRL